MKIYESTEDYLETIYTLSKQLPHVRSIDVVNEMGYSKPSVSNAMKKFRENDLVTINEHGHITLTQTGLEIATRIYERHQVLTEYLITLGVTEQTAKKDACRLEHDMSDETFNALKQHLALMTK